MYAKLRSKEWIWKALYATPTVPRQVKASKSQKLWFWFWKQCVPAHTGFVGRPI